VARILALAVAAAFYPALIAVVILLLARPGPLRPLAAFLAGGLSVSVLAGLAILAAMRESGTVDAKHASNGGAIQLVLGLACLAVAALLATGRLQRKERKPKPEGPSPRLERMLGRRSLPLAFLVGIVLNLPGLWYLAGLSQIAAGGYGTAAAVALVVAFNVVMFAPAEVPVAGLVLAPDRVTDRVQATQSWVSRHSHGLKVALATVVGCYLVASGLAGLL
jgi:hypothetical protein